MQGPGRERVRAAFTHYVIASAAKQSRATGTVPAALDCFVAALLAMTIAAQKFQRCAFDTRKSRNTWMRATDLSSSG